MSTLQARLSPREMARLIDGEPVEIRTNDRTIVLTGSVPDWEAREEPDVEAREAQAAYDDEWIGRRS
jgi:hypothetical protein